MPKGIPSNPRVSAEQLLCNLSPWTRRQVLRDIVDQRRQVESRLRDLGRTIDDERLRLSDLKGRVAWYALTDDISPIVEIVDRHREEP